MIILDLVLQLYLDLVQMLLSSVKSSVELYHLWVVQQRQQHLIITYPP